MQLLSRVVTGRQLSLHRCDRELLLELPFVSAFEGCDAEDVVVGLALEVWFETTAQLSPAMRGVCLVD